MLDFLDLPARVIGAIGMEVSARVACAGVIALIAVHPATFFLKGSYSESLFLTAMIGFVFWGECRGGLAWLLAGLHGIVMTATRVVGVCIAFFPWPRPIFAAQGPGVQPARLADGIWAKRSS